MKKAVFPGSFDPLTVGHLAVADAAYDQVGLDRVELVVSASPIGKESATQAPLQDRLEAIRSASSSRPWLSAGVTEHQLLVDIAQGYDCLIVGGDKAAQLLEPSFYGGSEAERDLALSRLPALVVAPRPGGFVPDDAIVLELPEWVAGISSTAVRSGRVEWKA